MASQEVWYNLGGSINEVRIKGVGKMSNSWNLLQECTYSCEDYLRGNGTGHRPIHFILTNGFQDGTCTGNVQFSDLGFNAFQEYLTAVSFKWRTDTPDVLQALDSFTNAAGE
ncbi:uncharacterized protein PAC_06376 [Phialocephala subalpina]|uniref:Uncharacterized protein n=1 Tax=Phialocephala subalpina TaxID=576137 RepID=A0A1L7WUP8_9HELO|nr:uncharacterized protein PAC_06376 [Phialocephala subalpina]